MTTEQAIQRQKIAVLVREIEAALASARATEMIALQMASTFTLRHRVMFRARVIWYRREDWCARAYCRCMRWLYDINVTARSGT